MISALEGQLQAAGTSARFWLTPLLNHSASASSAARVVEQFYFVNRAFVLGLPFYLRTLAKELNRPWDTSQSADREELEEVFAAVAKILADESQAGGVHGGRFLHHNLLLRLAEPFGADAEGLRTGRVTPTAATTRVVHQIHSSLTDPCHIAGVAAIAAVERIALPMILSMKDFFVSAAPASGQSPPSAHQLEHLDLHIALEVDHANETQSLVSMVRFNGDLEAVARSHAHGVVQSFHDFWLQFSVGAEG